MVLIYKEINPVTTPKVNGYIFNITNRNMYEKRM